MRPVVLFVNRDVYGLIIVNLILKHCDHEKIHIIYSNHKLPRSRGYNEHLEILHFFEQTSMMLLLESFDLNLKVLTFDELDNHFLLSYDVINQIDNDAINLISSLQCHVALSVRYGAIMPKKLIQKFPLGVFNLHSGLLPNYRGVLPTFRSMADKSTHMGMTLHSIDDESIDKGAIYSSSLVEIDYSVSLVENLIKNYEEGFRLIKELFDSDFIVKRQLIRSSNQENYYSMPTNEEVLSFYANGMHLLPKSLLA